VVAAGEERRWTCGFHAGSLERGPPFTPDVVGPQACGSLDRAGLGAVWRTKRGSAGQHAPNDPPRPAVAERLHCGPLAPGRRPSSALDSDTPAGGQETSGVGVAGQQAAHTRQWAVRRLCLARRRSHHPCEPRSLIFLFLQRRGGVPERFRCEYRPVSLTFRWQTQRQIAPRRHGSVEKTGPGGGARP